MCFRRNDPDKVKQKISPQRFYSEELNGFHTRKKEGWVDAGLCPFHDDKHSGSFFVNLDSGGFNCFSCGRKGGDVIDFVRERNNVTFPEALKMLLKFMESI